jgi:hypothetical protein
MTNGDIQRLQELSKCSCLPRRANAFVEIWLDPYWGNADDKMNKNQKARLRSLTHQYRHQIAAIKRNQKAMT